MRVSLWIFYGIVRAGWNEHHYVRRAAIAGNNSAEMVHRGCHSRRVAGLACLFCLQAKTGAAQTAISQKSDLDRLAKFSAPRIQFLQPPQRVCTGNFYFYRLGGIFCYLRM